MKAISLWQPWASLWMAGRKRFETRHWETKHRGALANAISKRRHNGMANHKDVTG